MNTICFLLNLFLADLPSKFHLVRFSSEGLQKQEQLDEEQEMKIMESEEIKGEQKNLVLGIIE